MAVLACPSCGSQASAGSQRHERRRDRLHRRRDGLDAKAAVDAAGIGCEPASAAAVADAKKLAASGAIAKDERGPRVVCILTGHLLKDPDTTMAYHANQILRVEAERANPPLVIDATPEALERALVPSGEPS
jgi:threonine synthase